jgi:hypothetical protein
MEKEKLDPLDRTLEDMRGSIDRSVAAGFAAPHEIVDNAVALREDELDPAFIRPLAESFIREALAAHQEAQAGWPAATDCDWVDQAFDYLEQKGIVCRQNFSCCGTCGAGEIWDEMNQAQQEGVIRGYAFYHMQDTESAADGYGLYLSYGAVEEGEAAALEIGNETQKALELHDLKTHWEGSWSTRIAVQLDWKRRR